MTKDKHQKKQVDVSALGRAAAEWFNSNDGSKARQSCEDAKFDAAKIKQARQIDYQAAHTPFNI